MSWNVRGVALTRRFYHYKFCRRLIRFVLVVATILVTRIGLDKSLEQEEEEEGSSRFHSGFVQASKSNSVSYQSRTKMSLLCPRSIAFMTTARTFRYANSCRRITTQHSGTCKGLGGLPVLDQYVTKRHTPCMTLRRSTSSLSSSSSSSDNNPLDENFFLGQVEETIQRVLLSSSPSNDKTVSSTLGNVQEQLNRICQETDILQLPPQDRQAFGVAKHLHQRLQSFRVNHKDVHCSRCWYQRAHCICSQCPSLERTAHNDKKTTLIVSPLRQETLMSTRIGRIFLLVHHKEILLLVDTAKVLLAAFPYSCRLVIAGIGPEYQHSMNELENVLDQSSRNDTPPVMVLFPSDDAKTITELQEAERAQALNFTNKASSGTDLPVDLIVIDGTWEQARRMYKRYIEGSMTDTEQHYRDLQHVQLSDEALSTLTKSSEDSSAETGAQWGRQLRRHPEMWREISTLAATRMLLQDMSKKSYQESASSDHTGANYWDVLTRYQCISDAAALKQLGTPRRRS